MSRSELFTFVQLGCWLAAITSHAAWIAMLAMPNVMSTCSIMQLLCMNADALPADSQTSLPQKHCTLTTPVPAAHKLSACKEDAPVCSVRTALISVLEQQASNSILAQQLHSTQAEEYPTATMYRGPQLPRWTLGSPSSSHAGHTSVATTPSPCCTRGTSMGPAGTGKKTAVVAAACTADCPTALRLAACRLCVLTCCAVCWPAAALLGVLSQCHAQHA